MTEFFTWDILTTLSGSILFVTVFTETIKFYIPKLNPKWIALVGSFLVIGVVQVVHVQNYSIDNIVLAIFNLFAVLCGSVGAFETILKPVERKIQDHKSSL